MIFTLPNRFDDYKTMGDVFLNFKNGLLVITYVEKLLQIITLFFQKIFTEQTSQK
jgi:hypothetical protein